ncbi:MAG: winged helix DNA-binding domain-containing protein [Bryobacteraceae bacterium]
MNLIGYRLANQQLAQKRFNRAADLVSWLGAVQAQDYAGAKWAVGQRLPASTDAELDQAFAEGAILRTHVMRPTWHFVSPSDIRWMLALTAPRVNAAMAYYQRQHELDTAFFARSHKLMRKALEGGRELTRQELASALQRAGLVKPEASNHGQRMGHIMARAELDAVVCSGARRGKQFTYALLDERAPHAKLRSRTEALAELVLRYFTSHGPATLADFVWWSGLTVKDARTGLDAVTSKLLSDDFGGRTYWMSTVIPTVQNSARTAYLLPNYDEYVVAYADRQAIAGPPGAKSLAARGSVLLNYTILLDGRIAGTWKRSVGKAGVTIEANTFSLITNSQRDQVIGAAERYGAFLGLEAHVSFTSL